MASRLRPRNWRGETRNQELERRVKALEASVQSAHDRINEMDERHGSHVHCMPVVGRYTERPYHPPVDTGINLWADES
jgi:hypothetical protein